MPSLESTRSPSPWGRKAAGAAVVIALVAAPRVAHAQPPGAAGPPMTETPRTETPRTETPPTDRTAWSDTAGTPDVPVLFTFSGGISLGAYQAGVNWALIEFFKRVRRDAQYRRDHALPVYRVAAMTGASAGNVNVLLGAVEYCDATTRRRPQESLLWKMWVHTGWNELLPPPGRRDSLSGDRGVLDRGSVRRHVLPAIETAMRRADGAGRAFVPRCDVPLGVIATRIGRGTIAFDRHIRVANQRYVAIFQVRERDGTLHVVRPDTALLREPSFGAQIVLPAEELGVINPDRVFDVVQASAAYPVAFAPNVVVFQQPACVTTVPTPPGCTDYHHESFMDGGVFDNVPVSLAVGMERRLRGTDAPSRVIYVDPSAARGRLWDYLQHREQVIAETRAEGIDALLRFVGGFVSSARSYELQSFIRGQLSLGPDRRAWLKSSTRAHPVVGEYLGAFAAFLGRPFREYDFYNGVADGMYFIASEILCDPVRLSVTGASGGAGPRVRVAQQGMTREESSQLERARTKCTEDETRNLVHDPGWLDDVGRHVTARVLHRELPDLAVPPVLDTARDGGVLPAARARALVAVEQATYAMLLDRRGFRCPSGDVAASVLCFDGFERVIGALARDTSFAKLIDAVHDMPICDPAGRAYDVARCPAERSLRKLLRHPHGMVQDVIDQAFRQLRTAEEAARDAGQPNFRLAVKTAEFVYRSADHKGRDGGDLDPSSIPPQDGWRWAWMHALPYYAGGTIGISGAQVGWQPTYHLGRHALALTLPAEAYHVPDGYEWKSSYHWWAGVTPSVARNFSVRWLNQVAVGGRVRARMRWREPESGHVMPQVTAVTLLGKLRVTAYRVPGDMTASGRARWVGSASLADINGLAYLVFR